MKLKYRTFDDTEYTEVECTYFDFKYDENLSDKPILFIFGYEFFSNIENVCEVYIEEL